MLRSGRMPLAAPSAYDLAIASSRGRTGAVVVRAVVHVVAVGQRRAQADVIQMRADHHVFVLLHRIRAFEDADHVFGVTGLASSPRTCSLSVLAAFSSNESSLALAPAA